MKSFFKNKNNIIIGLCAILILMGIGFAAFSQRLEIGDTTVTNSDWNVYIKSAVAGTPVGGATGSAQVVDRASAKLTANLSSPGDSVTYTITVANDGNIDAVLDLITLSASNSDSVIKYSYAGITEDEDLLAQTETSFTVTIEYDSTKTGTATAEQKQNTLTLDLDYVQKGTETIVIKPTSTFNMNGVDVGVYADGSGVDGLYTDPVESGRYVYRGADPDNYIWLDLNGDTTKTDNETYRIMSVESDDTIKVVAQNELRSIVFDPGYKTAIDGVTSTNSNEGTRYSSTSTDYCYISSASSYNGCNAWGSSTTTLDANGNNVTVMPREVGDSTTYTLPSTEAYLNTYLNTTFLSSIDTDLQNKIATHTFNIGPLKNASDQTLATDISQESAYKWNGKIGLMNATDCVRASTNSSCTNVYAYFDTSGCYSNSDTHNYLFHSYAWTMSPDSGWSAVWYVHSSYFYSSYARSSHGVWPSFYLTSDISLSGKGTSGEPYEIG